MKFVSRQTFAELREIWKKYAEVKTSIVQDFNDAARRAEIKKSYDKRYGTGGTSYTFYAGPHWQEGIGTMNVGLRGYWSKGVVGGNASDVEALGNGGKGFSNPLYMVSSTTEKFNVESTSDPLTSFHLTEVLDKRGNESKDILAMVTLAKTQFITWCKAFADYASSSTVQINLHFGDAVTFCHELAARNGRAPSSAGITRVYARQWSSKPLLLDGDGGATLPLFFDVIDTSNLVDWVGLLNLLPPMVNLLSARSTSVIWTEKLRLMAYEPEKDMFESMLMDVCLGSLLLGVAPLGHLLGYAMDNTMGEDCIHCDNINRYRMHILWKPVVDHATSSPITSNPNDFRVHFEAEELAEILFGVFMKMFEIEDLKKSMKKMKARKPLNAHLYNRYSRLTYAGLIQHILGRVETNVQDFAVKLHAKIAADTTLHMGDESIDDLITQLAISGAIVKPSSSTGSQVVPAPFKSAIFVVPRAALGVFKHVGGAPVSTLQLKKRSLLYLHLSTVSLVV